MGIVTRALIYAIILWLEIFEVFMSVFTRWYSHGKRELAGLSGSNILGTWFCFILKASYHGLLVAYIFVVEVKLALFSFDPIEEVKKRVKTIELLTLLALIQLVLRLMLVKPQIRCNCLRLLLRQWTNGLSEIGRDLHNLRSTDCRT